TSVMDSSNKYKYMPDNACKRKREEENSLFPPSKKSNEGKMSKKSCCQDKKNETKIMYESLLSDLRTKLWITKCMPDNAGKRKREEENLKFPTSKKSNEGKMNSKTCCQDKKNEVTLEVTQPLRK
ncbi:hypothetical protein OTU49_005627, partial [Cherax quadricarinatus]